MVAKKILSILLLIILPVLFYTCKAKPTDAPIIETKIAGRVLDKESNNIIVGAQITTNPTTSSVTTDASGSFTITDVKAGQYIVNASKNGYKTNSISVDVTEGKIASADILIQILKPELTLSAASVDFGTNLSNASLVITNGSGINSIDWTATTNVSWLALSQKTGTVSTASNTITITVDRTGLSYGNYSTNISIASSVGNKDVSITMTIANPNAPQLTVNPLLLDLGASLSQSSFFIRNSGTGKIVWSASKTAQWISLNPQSDSTTTETDEVKMSINRSGLSPGDYSANVSVLSNAGSQDVNVKINVPTVPSLSLSSTSLDFDSTKNQISFNINNGGTGTLNWTANGNKNWMIVQPQNGTNTGTINVNINRASLSPGNYSGGILVSSNGGSGNVAITMEVPYPAPPSPVTASLGTITTNSIQINWSQYTASDFSSYKVYYSTSSTVNETSTLATTILTKSNTTYTITGLSTNTQYNFRVFVINQSSQTAGSNTVAGNTEKPLPSWQLVALPVNFQVQSMHYISESEIWAAGYSTISNYNFPRIYKYNGSIWTQSTVQAQDSSGTLTAIAFRNNSEGWAASESKIYKYNGSSWDIAYYLTYPNLIEAIGTTNDVWFYGQKTYRWDGSQLSDQNLSNGYTVRDMHFYNASTGYAIDESRTVYMFNGGGWVSLGEISNSAFYNSFTVSGTSIKDVWAQDYYLYHYDGTSWKRQNDVGGNAINYSFSQIRMISPTEGWATKSGSFAPYYLYYFNGTSWTNVGTLTGKIEKVKDFGNSNLWGIINGNYSGSNKLMRFK